jgi:hypothetical protein
MRDRATSAVGREHRISDKRPNREREWLVGEHTRIQTDKNHPGPPGHSQLQINPVQCDRTPGNRAHSEGHAVAAKCVGRAPALKHDLVKGSPEPFGNVGQYEQLDGTTPSSGGRPRCAGLAGKSGRGFCGYPILVFIPAVCVSRPPTAPPHADMGSVTSFCSPRYPFLAPRRRSPIREELPINSLAAVRDPPDRAVTVLADHE